MTVAAPCPGCGGSKSKRARLCAGCRKKAYAVGASVVSEVTVAGRAAQMRTPLQNIVYRAKIADIAKLEAPWADKPESQLLQRAIAKRALVHAGEMFERPVTSSTQLTEIEMELLCEWLDDELDEIGGHAHAPA